MPACRRSQRGAIGRALLWTAGLVALLLGLLLAALTWGPNLARHRIAGFYSEVIGREIRIGHIEVSPFAGRVVVDDFSIASARPDRPALVVKRATVEIEASAYLHGVVVVKGVRLESPALHLVRIGPDRFDFSEVLDRFANRPPSQRKATWRIDRVTVEGGRLDLDDRLVKKATSIAGLSLQAVGLTNQDEHVERPATLDARFMLDGRPVAVQARATPFSSDPVFGGDVKLDALPIAALLPYLPLPADIRPVSGTVTLDLGGTWRQTAAAPTRLDVSGRLAVDGLAVHDGAGSERVAAESLVVVLGSSQPLGGAIHVTEATLRAPRAALGRDATGRMLWPAAADTIAATPAPAPAATAAQAPAGAAGQTSSQPSAAPSPAAPALPPNGPRSLRIDRLRIDSARIDWQDAALPAPLALQVSPLTLSLEAIEVADLARPAAASGRGRLDATVDGDAVLGADLLLDGSGGGRTSIDLSRIDVARYAPLAGPALRATVEQGRLAARATLAWGPDGAGLSVTDAAAELADLRIAKDGRVPATIASLAVAGGTIDPAARRIELGSVKLAGGTLQARRDRGGRVDLQDWWVPQDAPGTGASATSGPAQAQAETSGRDAPAWTVRVAQAEVAALEVDYDDAAIPKASKLPRLTLNAKASNIGTDPSQTMPFEAAVALADGSRLSARGSLRPVPLQLDAQVRLARFGITNIEPYIAPYVNLALASGQLWSNGRLRLTGDRDGGLARIGFDGEFSANDFRAIDRVTSDDFLRWTALALPSVKVDWRTGRPADSLIEIGAVAFVDFYARIILSPEGRLNLSEVVADPGRERGAAPRSLTAAPAASGPGGIERAPAGAATTARLPAAAAEGPRPTIRVGIVRIASGNVNFTDLFIRPNYTANLTQLVGSIEAIASDRAEPSDVLVTGRVDDDTPLEITGKINPLAPTSFIDLRAVARGFDLPKLSPYSGRWAGYAIEKGKLTADVRYRIEGDRLAAENKLTINQLTFGEKIDSPDATSLPVRFAVSLLKDRNGNIDLDLPISGTVSDPQFSVGGLLWRAIGNLIIKVVSSPFTFLASLGGGDPGELSHIEFAAGATALDDEDRKRLDTLSTALAQRPELSIEIAGVGDPKADRDAMQQARLERSLKGAKLAQMRRATPSAELPPIAELVIEAAERPVLLERAWRDAKLDAGRTGPVPPPEALERLLLEHAAVATEEVKQVAQQRAQAARDYLRDQRGIPNERLYLLAPRIADDDGKLPPRRADFTLK
ncbi:MAG: DUF748 domain-containing protein [Burkholderiales bacterium]|nr:DUF748 domain-containing protein [Burkholderiales bacterium]